MSAVLDLLWAKTNTRQGRQFEGPAQPHRVLAHLLDTAEVAGVMWDEWLAPIVKARIAALGEPGGLSGRDLVRWLAGVHDIGKISPAFQAKAPFLTAGLPPELAADVDSISRQDSLEWRHTLAGGRFLHDALSGSAWAEHADWISSVVGGHHGVWEEARAYRVQGSEGRRRHGGNPWDELRHKTLEHVTRVVGVADADGQFLPLAAPTPADVVLLTAIVITADWVASNGEVMPGIWGPQHEDTSDAAARAQAAWRTLRMHAGWNPDLLHPGDPFAARFPHIAEPRPVQRLAVDMAQKMPRAGLMIVEAPMGEGKTELSMAVAEVLARRFGSDGVFFGLPTQATADAILDRFTPWLGRVTPGSPVALAHGKAMINETMRALPPWTPTEIGIDCDEPRDHSDPAGASVSSVSSWFRSSKRLLLSPFVVGTIDNVLLAGAKTRHGCLRLLGLSSKIVILDEVHAADVYMSQFLERALSWLGSAGVPVVLMSATLPAAQRQGLIAAYTGLQPGATSHPFEDVSDYPRITVATSPVGGAAEAAIVVRAPTSDGGDLRSSVPVRVRILHEHDLHARSTADADAQVADLLDRKLSGGGCALVIRNTVGRAQSLYAAFRERFPDATVVLFHSRFTAGHKDVIAKRVLARLGKSTQSGVHRPRGGKKVIVVATQVAEQSLDIDADILVTDLCPIDLLLQRIGRMWRHTENTPLRPPDLVEPEVWVTRMHATPGDYAHPHPQSAIYPIALLTRTAHLIHRLNGGAIHIPGDIPVLVGEVYDRTADIPASAEEDAGYDNDQQVRQTTARNAAIRPANATGIGIQQPAAHGLNVAATDGERIMVRDGAISVEAVVLSKLPNGGYRLHTGLDGADAVLAESGSVEVGDMTTLAKVIASTVRLPKSAIVAPVLDLPPLPAWTAHPWLRDSHALILDEDDTATLNHTDDKGQEHRYEISYSAETGLSWSNY